MKETSICSICLEPIYNFICADCLHKDVQKWMESKSVALALQFETFHHSLDRHFSSEHNSEFCIKCRNVTDSVFCIYCYVKEVFQWIFFKDPWLAQSFVRLFNFDFAGTGFLMIDEIRNLSPIMLSEKRGSTDINICETCENHSNNLVENDGDWICENCNDYLNTSARNQYLEVGEGLVLS